ncbi:hypothetical protein [Bartonella gabonensis]|uniref:hypothetical protein n=1 Tax=Bartonella gabonensis TaxID=2699889 RepID=UPI001FEC8788|nr:hypothetical protein [Bartonella gabonensis]
MTKKLHSVRNDLRNHIRNVGKNGDLSLLIDTERSLVENDLLRYANSKAMISSLEIGVVKDHIKLISNPEKYDAINKGHSLSKHRKGGLPYDEARKAMASHYTRLGNLDKARLTDIEKSIIDARRENIKAMQKLYEKMQTKAIGIDF